MFDTTFAVFLFLDRMIILTASISYRALFKRKCYLCLIFNFGLKDFDML